MIRLTITLEDELSETIKRRAEFNRRSMSQEINFLIEAALAAELEVNLNMLRVMMKAGVNLPPAQTAKGEPLRDSSAGL